MPRIVTGLAIYVQLRGRTLTDDLVDPLIETTHHIGARAERRVEHELLDDPERITDMARNSLRPARRAGTAGRVTIGSVRPIGRGTRGVPASSLPGIVADFR